MKNLKFKVRGHEHSGAIQERLFQWGFSWFSGGKTIRHTDAKYLFCDQDFHICRSDVPSDWEEDHSIEATLDDLYDPEFYDQKTEEMTLEEVCKELGRTIKIVK